MAGGQHLEVEVKFLIVDLARLRRRLLQIGARPVRPRILEQNLRYDDADAALSRRDQLLRLRQDDQVVLTFKGWPPQPVVSEARVREELEVVVSDFTTADMLLQRLGFRPVQRYEKYRETFQLDPVAIVLDELPFGDFVELEGPESALKALARDLDLAWDRRILANYLALLAELQARHDLPFQDLTFANFKPLAVRVAEIRRPADGLDARS